MALTLPLLQGHGPEWALLQRHHSEVRVSNWLWDFLICEEAGWTRGGRRTLHCDLILQNVFQFGAFYFTLEMYQEVVEVHSKILHFFGTKGSVL
jgi:hypothetical protein